MASRMLSNALPDEVYSYWILFSFTVLGPKVAQPPTPEGKRDQGPPG